MTLAPDERRSVKLNEETYRALIGLKADLEKAMGEEFSLSTATDYLVAAASVSKLVESLQSVLRSMSQRHDKLDSYFELRELGDQLKKRDLLEILKRNLSQESQELWELWQKKEKQTTPVGSDSFARVLQRSGFDIRVDMLRAVKDGAETPTQIMYKANVSWLTLQQHLSMLVDNGSLRWVEGGNRKKYELTPKAEKILDNYSRLLRHVSGSRFPQALRETKVLENQLADLVVQMPVEGKTTEGDT